MNSRLIDDAHKSARSMFDATKAELGKIQSAPVGKELRSKRELNDMIRALQAMPHDERQSKMEEMARVMGHQGSQMDDCGLCNFLRDATQSGG
jgi:hypothetical protein